MLKEKINLVLFALLVWVIWLFTLNYAKASIEDTVQWMYNNNLTIHNTVEKFDIEDWLRRDEAAKFFVKLAGVLWVDEYKKSEDECVFQDIDDARSDLKDDVIESCKLWFFKWNHWNFHPTQNITNAQAITVLWRMLFENQDETLDHYSDKYYELFKQEDILSEVDMDDKNLQASRWNTASIIYAWNSYIKLLENSKKSDTEDNKSVSSCDLFPDKLEVCEPYSCQFIHPFTAEIMNKEIVGFVDDNKCNYIEQMPNDGMMKCEFTESVRKAVSQYYRDIAFSDSINTRIELKGDEVNVTYKIDGKEVENPLQEAMDLWECIFEREEDDNNEEVLRKPNEVLNANDITRIAGLNRTNAAIQAYIADTGKLPEGCGSLSLISGYLSQAGMRDIPMDIYSDSKFYWIWNDFVTSGNYGYCSITANGWENGAYVLMAKMETTGHTNYIANSDNVITENTNYEDIIRCDSIADIGGTISDNTCVYTSLEDLRYLLIQG